MKALTLNLSDVRVVPAGKEEEVFINVELDYVDEDDFAAGKEAEGDANDKDETQDERDSKKHG